MTISSFIASGGECRLSARLVEAFTEDERLLISRQDVGVTLGSSGHGEGFALPLIAFKANAVGLRQLAIYIVAEVLDRRDDQRIASLTSNPTIALTVRSAKGGSYASVPQPREFVYRKSKKAPKKYPWYPASSKWDPLMELPSFGLTTLPGKRIELDQWGRIDLRSAHAVCISGYPRALLRLARLLLAYADVRDPEDPLSLELEGGFRGVGLFSYPVWIERP
jgi:hypothetical protein